MSSRREPSPYGRGYDRGGNLVGAAKQQHEAKMAREQGGQPDEEEPRRSSRSPSPYGRGYDRQGNLVGAAKMMHEWKEQREHGVSELEGMGFDDTHGKPQLLI
jgi:hypothetical protein